MASQCKEVATFLIQNFFLAPSTASDVAQFFVVKAEALKRHHPAPISPPLAVDLVWHEMLLETELYAALCAMLGVFVHHSKRLSKDPPYFIEKRREEFESLRKELLGSIHIADDMPCPSPKQGNVSSMKRDGDTAMLDEVSEVGMKAPKLAQVSPALAPTPALPTDAPGLCAGTPSTKLNHANTPWQAHPAQELGANAVPSPAAHGAAAPLLAKEESEEIQRLKYERELMGLSVKVLAGQLRALQLPCNGIPKAGLIQRLVAHRFASVLKAAAPEKRAHVVPQAAPAASSTRAASSTAAPGPVSPTVVKATAMPTPSPARAALVPASPASDSATPSPSTASGDQLCNLRFIAMDASGTHTSDSEVIFKLRRSTRLGKAFSAYCAKFGLSQNMVRFVSEGALISDDETSETFGLEDNDTIDVIPVQAGC